MKISAVLIVKNEEKNIEKCLTNLLWCDEIIVVDDDSSDKTREIIKKYRIRLFKHSLNNDFSRQRNFALSKAKGDWILFVDADEIISSSLQKEIIQKINNSKNNYSGYFIRRRDFIWGKELKHGEVGDIRLLRLAKKESGKWIGKVHEVWRIKGRIGKLNQPIDHYAHKSTSTFLEKINYYTDIRAKELYERNIKSHWWSIIFYPVSKLFLNYILKLGFLDGIEGLVFSFMMSLHSFLVRAKLWFLWKRI